MNPFESFCQEVVALFHRLRLATEQLHSGNELTAGRRGVMLSLLNGGPRTVPQLARARPVSRQHIRTIVTPDGERGAARTGRQPEPQTIAACSTDRARPQKHYADANERRDALRRFGFTFRRSRLHEAADTLRRVREFFDGDWQAAEAMSPKTKARMKQ